MEFLKETSFARAMNLIFSLEDSLSDGPIENSFARKTFERLVFDVLGRLEYEYGYAWYDYEHRLIKAKVWTSHQDDVIVVTFNTDNSSIEISYLDTDFKQKRSFLQKLGDLFRTDITWDPLTMDMKFSLSALRK